MHSQPQAMRALLATAIIPLRNENGLETIVRALIDQGSACDLITEKADQALQCHKTKIIPMPMIGVGDVQTGTSKYITSFTLDSTNYNRFNFKMGSSKGIKFG